LIVFVAFVDMALNLAAAKGILVSCLKSRCIPLVKAFFFVVLEPEGPAKPKVTSVTHSLLRFP